MAIVYLRAGYAPTDYLDDSYWAGRLAIERSNAVKCAYRLSPSAPLSPSLAFSRIGEQLVASLDLRV